MGALLPSAVLHGYQRRTRPHKTTRQVPHVQVHRVPYMVARSRHSHLVLSGLVQEPPSSRTPIQIQRPGLYNLHRGILISSLLFESWNESPTWVVTARVFFPAQMGIASAVHLLVFPAQPYAIMGDRVSGSVSVMGDYVSVECPVDPEEVRDSERPTKLRLPQRTDGSAKSGMNIRDSVRDVVLGGGGYVCPSFLRVLCFIYVLILFGFGRS